jgi:uncharacterized membrane protein YccC
MHIGLDKLDVVAALRIMLVVALTEGTGFLFGTRIPGASAEVGGLWAAASGIVVLQASSDEVMPVAIKRVLGTLIGAVISGLYLALLPNNVLASFVCIMLTVLICQLLGVPDNGRLGCVTVLVVLVVSALHPGLSPWVNASLRFFEAMVGSGVALGVAWLWPHREPGQG